MNKEIAKIQKSVNVTVIVTSPQNELLAVKNSVRNKSDENLTEAYSLSVGLTTPFTSALDTTYISTTLITEYAIVNDGGSNEKIGKFSPKNQSILFCT